jgi:outer membrane protein assembly factor BamB
MKYNRKIVFLIAATLIISMASSVVLIPTTNAHTPPWNIPTYAYVNAAPDPIGVGQKITINMWLSAVAPGAEFGNDIRWHNYQLTITAPDGTKTTQTFAIIEDPTSNQLYYYTPTQVGTYNVSFTFPGQTYTWTMAPGFFGLAPSAYTNDTYAASSASTTFIVQEEAIQTIPTAPLPTNYWTRPIYGENPNWWTISSNWLGTGAPGYSSGLLGATFQPYAVGSQTSHIMWTKPIQSGGVVGGNDFQTAGDTYYEGTAYALRFPNPIILDGKLYYTEPLSLAGATAGRTVCVNLQTGEEVWSSNTIPALSFGYIYDVQDPNQHGVYQPIIVATVGGSFLGPPVPLQWLAFDADTGRSLFNITNVPAGTAVMGPQGERLIISLVNYGTPSQPNYYLQEWNSSRLWGNNYSGPSTTPPVVPPILNGADPSLYDWNVSVPALNTIAGTPSIKSAFYNGMLIGESGTMPNAGNNIFSSQSWTPYTYFGINLDSTSGTIGTIQWKNTLNAPSGNLTVSYDGADPSVGVFVEYYAETMQYVGYSMDTGNKLWGPTVPETALDFFSMGYGGQGPTLAYGKLYAGGYSGLVYCFDLTNGNLLWTYGNGGAGNTTSAGTEFARNYPTIISAIANGIVYTVTSEHTFETPIYKGALVRALNATTGQEIWTLSAATGDSTAFALADGFTVFDNGYDNQIYTTGRGPSETSVNAQAFGDSIVISGLITDNSPGTQQTQQAADFPHGVPCASDESMSDWMGYVYQQQAIPNNFTGVPVTISVLDSNGNYYSIGTTTTDIMGSYSLTYKPSIPGTFTVYANFAGTNAYWPSSAEAHFYESEPAASTPAPTAAPLSMADQYFVPAFASIIILIILVGAVLGILLVRKRP